MYVNSCIADTNCTTLCSPSCQPTFIHCCIFSAFLKSTTSLTWASLRPIWLCALWICSWLEQRQPPPLCSGLWFSSSKTLISRVGDMLASTLSLLWNSKETRQKKSLPPCYPSNSCWDIPVWSKVVDRHSRRQRNTATAWLKMIRICIITYFLFQSLPKGITGI